MSIWVKCCWKAKLEPTTALSIEWSLVTLARAVLVEWREQKSTCDVFKKRQKKGFPGGPVVRPWHFHSPGSIPGGGTKILQAAAWQNKTKQNKTK